MSFSATHLHSDHRGESVRWRWFVLWTSCSLAALATSIVFGLLHVPGWLFMKGVSATTLSLIGPVVFVGVVLAAISWRVPSLWACIAVHLANNAWNGGLVSALARSLGHLAHRVGLFV